MYGTLHVKIEGLATSKKANLTITSMLGQTIMSSKIMDGENMMDVSALGAGVYIVSVLGDGVNYTERFVKIE